MKFTYEIYNPDNPEALFVRSPDGNLGWRWTNYGVAAQWPAASFTDEERVTFPLPDGGQWRMQLKDPTKFEEGDKVTWVETKEGKRGSVNFKSRDGVVAKIYPGTGTAKIRFERKGREVTTQLSIDRLSHEGQGDRLTSLLFAMGGNNPCGGNVYCPRCRSAERMSLRGRVWVCMAVHKGEEAPATAS